MTHSCDATDTAIETTLSARAERTGKVLVIGAGGNVSRHSVPWLAQQGHDVTGLVRNPAHVERIEQAGARALVQDITELSVAQWAELLGQYDVVVWSAGAGGGSAERTYAVDRDAALRVVEALEQLEVSPRFLMVSYAGARFATAEDDGGSWYAYVEAKKAVDLQLMESDLPQVILGPGMLVDGPVPGFAPISADRDDAGHPQTSRELVAEVIVELVGREDISGVPNPFEFQNGSVPVRDLGR
ncbi:NAD(P)H-binding protein [Corynebacterium sp. p3-SID1056]|uniref:NAD(P)H-binding protein n=1 Tax=Corynebacterium sp. p3-SID1056 TaxID=2916092 RepID=UPI0021A3F387|nr:NAD(P)H-binding protein [Corynebacterium sp. p3-SID1056]MCT2338844.1 NAD(P)H-binding protein [Corynebacterium sp. p3-SID1056]